MGKFKDTKFGKFLGNVGDKLSNGGGIASIVAKATTGNIVGALADTKDLLMGNASPEAKKLLQEFELKIKEFEIEMYRLDAADRDSARNREIEIAKAGGQDIMMMVAGGVALVAFLLVLVTVLFIDIPEKNEKLVYHVLGITEGVAISVFTYYFGSSKGSADKQKKIEKN